jgi:hypothetical protein
MIDNAKQDEPLCLFLSEAESNTGVDRASNKKNMG